MRDLITAAPIAGDPVLRVIFIEDMRKPNPQDPSRPTKINTRTGLAITDTSYVESLQPTDTTLTPLALSKTGVLFIATAQMSGGQFNGRTVAHEIAHAVVGQDKANDASGGHVAEPPNILRDGAVLDSSVLRKRFNGAQQDLLYRSNRYVRYPPKPVFGGSQ
jgi:hypothetical protein